MPLHTFVTQFPTSTSYIQEVRRPLVAHFIAFTPHACNHSAYIPLLYNADIFLNLVEITCYKPLLLSNIEKIRGWEARFDKVSDKPGHES